MWYIVVTTSLVLGDSSTQRPGIGNAESQARTVWLVVVMVVMKESGVPACDNLSADSNSVRGHPW